MAFNLRISMAQWISGLNWASPRLIRQACWTIDSIKYFRRRFGNSLQYFGHQLQSQHKHRSFWSTGAARECWISALALGSFV